MRVLLAPQIYTNHDYLEGNSTVTDMMYWTEAWLEIDPDIHIYWMIPSQQDVGYDREDLCLDHERVTAIERRFFHQNTKFSRMDSWREEHLEDIYEEIQDKYGYFDIVISQQGERQHLLWKFLNEAQGYAYSQVDPFQMIKHLHDFNAPWKDHVQRFRGDAMLTSDLKSMLDAQRVWLRSEWDRDEFKKASKQYLSYDAINSIDEKMKYVDTPIDFGDLPFDEFGDAPKYVHMAGTPNIGKKNRGLVVELVEKLYQRYDTELLITSMATVEKDYKEKPFVTAYDNCSWEKYKEILAKGDICICPTEYETGGKTWFEQAASGQVFIVLSEPWVQEYLDDYRLQTSSKSGLMKLTVWAMKNWDEAVAETKELNAKIKERRSPETIGKVTHDDMAELVTKTIMDYDLKWDEEVLSNTMEYLPQRPVSIKKIDSASAKFTDTEKPITSLFGYTTVDLVHALRNLGYKDTGSRVPSFTEVTSDE